MYFIYVYDMYLFVYDISSLPVISFQRGFDSWMHDLNTAHLACSHSWCMCTMNFQYISIYLICMYIYIYILIYMYIYIFLFFYTKTYMYVYVYLSMTIYNILYIYNIIIQNVYLYISAFPVFLTKSNCWRVGERSFDKKFLTTSNWWGNVRI